ncbi:hypothetical protein ACJX0J_021743, partial [Zea mays]
MVQCCRLYHLIHLVFSTDSHHEQIMVAEAVPKWGYNSLYVFSNYYLTVATLDHFVVFYFLLENTFNLGFFFLFLFVNMYLHMSKIVAPFGMFAHIILYTCWCHMFTPEIGTERLVIFLMHAISVSYMYLNCYLSIYLTKIHRLISIVVVAYPMTNLLP